MLNVLDVALDPAIFHFGFNDVVGDACFDCAADVQTTI
jgi:hypothetical protein